jgi:signal peptidase II
VIYAIAVVLVLILDQAVKFWTTKNILLDAVGDNCVELIRGVVHMTNVHNYGAAFSILQNARWLLIVITAVFVIGIIVLLNQEIIHTKFGKWAAVGLLAGALGNCIDRVLYGYVVDMFEFEFFTFPVFNVADIFITVFGVLFIIHVIFHNEPEAVKKANEPEFMRRRREEKAALETPVTPEGKRPAPKPDTRPSVEEDDPFQAWSFGSVVKDKSAADPVKKQAPAAKPAAAPAVEDEDFSFDLPLPQKRAVSIPQEVSDEDLSLASPSKPASDSDETFSLEDILSEFGDL